MEDSQISEYESRTFLRRTQRYFAKGFRRNRARKVAYVVLSGLQLLLFCFFAIVFPWIIDGESISQQFTPEEKYFSAIISLSGGFCFVFGLSSILRSNIFEMIAATMMSFISSSKLFIVITDGIRHDRERTKLSVILAIVIVNLISMIMIGMFVVRAFGWTLYLKIGSHQHLRVAFQNFLLFHTIVELDVIFLTFLVFCEILPRYANSQRQGFVQLSFFSDTSYSYVICILGMLYNYAWAVFSFLCVRREVGKFFPVPYVVSGVWTHPYLIYKLLDMLFIRPARFANVPRSSIVLTIMLSVVFRIVLVVFGLKCSANFKIGLQERLDEIGTMFGGQ